MIDAIPAGVWQPAVATITAGGVLGVFREVHELRKEHSKNTGRSRVAWRVSEGNRRYLRRDDREELPSEYDPEHDYADLRPDGGNDA